MGEKPSQLQPRTAQQQQPQQQQIDDIESDHDEIEDPIGDSEQESEIDEDLPLEMDDVRSTNKVCLLMYLLFFSFDLNHH